MHLLDTDEEREIYSCFIELFEKWKDGENHYQVCNRVDADLNLPPGQALDVLRKAHPIKRLSRLS